MEAKEEEEEDEEEETEEKIGKEEIVIERVQLSWLWAGRGDSTYIRDQANANQSMHDSLTM